MARAVAQRNNDPRQDVDPKAFLHQHKLKKQEKRILQRDKLLSRLQTGRASDRVGKQSKRKPKRKTLASMSELVESLPQVQPGSTVPGKLLDPASSVKSKLQVSKFEQHFYKQTLADTTGQTSPFEALRQKIQDNRRLAGG